MHIHIVSYICFPYKIICLYLLFLIFFIFIIFSIFFSYMCVCIFLYIIIISLYIIIITPYVSLSTNHAQHRPFFTRRRAHHPPCSTHGKGMGGETECPAPPKIGRGLLPSHKLNSYIFLLNNWFSNDKR